MPGVDIQQIGIRLQEPLDTPRWKAAWQIVTQRFDVLRSYFTLLDGIANRAVLREYRIPVVEEDWRTSVPHADWEKAIARLYADDRANEFDPLSDVPQRLKIIQLADDDFFVLWTFHHLLLDGRSFALVLGTLFEEYDGQQTDFSAVTEMTEYLKVVNAPVTEDNLLFWKKRLSSLDRISSFRSTPRQETSPGLVDVVRESFHATEIRLCTESSESLRNTASNANCSIHNVIQAAWALLLAHHNGQETVCFGSVRACRHSVPDAENLVGLLINTVPFVVNVSSDVSVQALLQSVLEEQRALRGVETSPLSVVQTLVPFDGGSAFDTAIMFDSASLNSRMHQLDYDRFSHRHFTYLGQTNFPITLVVYGDLEISLRIEHYSSYIPVLAAENLMGELSSLLQALGQIEEPDSVVAMTVPYVDSAVLAQLNQWNDTASDYGEFKPLSEALKEQALLTPNAIALQLDEQSLSYIAFDAAVNRLANYLQSEGVAVGDIVGVCTERSIDLLVAVHATVRAGAAFMPLDPEFPDERLDYMVSNANAALVLAQDHLVGRFTAAGLRLLNISDPLQWSHCAEHCPQVEVSPHNAAYVLYTSGSTGRPKGVINTHEGIVNRLNWMQDALGLGHDDVVLQKTPCSFDVSVWELFWPFMVGARLEIAKPGGHRDPEYLSAVIQSRQVTVLHFVPSMLQLFMDEPTIGQCQGIRQIICSGEALPKTLQDRVFSHLSCRLHNLYGPTEAAIDVTWWECDRHSALSHVPLGRPVANTQLHVLDGAMQVVPVGVTGELCIGGIQVALGYVNQPELTQEKFLADPFRVGGMIYRTGDLARWNEDGVLEYLGRLDHQVKIRGQRVELGEIEQVLLAHFSVREVIVTVSIGSNGQNRLTAYVVPVVDSSELAAHVSSNLPSYMVPSVWMSLDKFPLNASGKVDRNRLPDPALQQASTKLENSQRTFEGKSQAEVLKIWQSLLGTEDLSLDDRYFDCGGDSLSLLTLRNRLREELGLEASVTQLIASSSIREQAALVEAQKQTGSDGQAEIKTPPTNSVAARALQRQQAIKRRRKRQPDGSK